MFRWLDEGAFQTALLSWTQSLCQVSDGQIMALDGKKLRGSEAKAQHRPGIWRVSAWATAADFLTAIRDHWQIENGLHWVLDIAFREDSSRIRQDHAPKTWLSCDIIALNLLKQETSASWDRCLKSCPSKNTMSLFIKLSITTFYNICNKP